MNPDKITNDANVSCLLWEDDIKKIELLISQGKLLSSESIYNMCFWNQLELVKLVRKRQPDIQITKKTIEHTEDYLNFLKQLGNNSEQVTKMSKLLDYIKNPDL